MNLNETAHYLPCLDKKSLFCLNPLEMPNNEHKCDIIQSMIKIIWNMWKATDN